MRRCDAVAMTRITKQFRDALMTCLVVRVGGAQSVTINAAETHLARSDAELIAAVRAGDNTAYGLLFERHRSAALRLARQLLTDSESEDLVSEAFTKVFVLLQDGKGPDVAFRAYLLTAIRRLHVDRIRAGQRVRTTDNEAELDRHVQFFDIAAINFERGTAADAFASLPERWQLVLWHLDVEGQKPAEIASLLGMSANGVSALAYRAREGLRQSYLQHHLADTAEGDCRWTTQRLGAFVRRGLSNRESLKVDEHLSDCRRCMGIYLELTEINSNLAGVLAPAILGVAATGYLAAGSTAVAGATGVTGLAAAKAFLLNSVFEPLKVAIVASPGASVAVAVVVVAATGAVTVAATNIGSNNPPAAPPVSAPSIPGPSTAPSPAPIPTPNPTTIPTTIPSTLPSAIPTVPQLPAPETVPAPVFGAVPAEPVPLQPEPPTRPATPTPAPIVATDFGLGAIMISNDDTAFQRRFTIPVTSTTSGPAQDLRVSLTVAFDHTVFFRGVVSSEWRCDAPARNRPMKLLTCTRMQSGPQVPPLVFKVIKLLPPEGTISVSAAGNQDPTSTNNTTRFIAPRWLLR